MLMRTMLGSISLLKISCLRNILYVSLPLDEKENGNQEVELANEGPANEVHSMAEWHPTRQENPPPPGR